jgi:pilus assembly protein CpaE
MKQVIRLAVVDPGDATRGSLKNLLLGIESVWLEAECSKYEFFSDVANQTQPDVALVAIDADPNKALNLVTKITQDLPLCQVLVLSSSTEGNLILRAMRSGAREFLNLPLKIEDFMAALDRMRSVTNRGTDSGPRSSQIITVAGVSGGVGCTSLAVNLSCILARNDKNSVTLIDLDFATGDADVWLDIIPEYTIQDVADNISRLDYSLLKRSLTRHDSGVFLLPRPIHFDDSLKITAEQLRRVITLLKATFSHLVIDVTKHYGSLDMAAMEMSDVVLLVTQLDLPCLRNIVRLLQYFDGREGLSSKIKIVVDRMGMEDTQISLNKAVETIGRPVFWQLPNDYASMVESRNNGVPLIMQSGRARITRSIEQLAAALDVNSAAATTPRSEADAAKKAKKSGFFSFLSSNSGS